MKMSKNITDIANWVKEYPFLNEVWDFYNKFDLITDKDTYHPYIQPLCNMILQKNGMNIGAYNNFCTKLLKNLGHYSKNEKSIIRSYYHCNILYNWIYNSKEKHDIPDEFINDCFEDYIKICSLKEYNYSCSYDTYNSLYKEPINITLLNIFESNMGTIINTLNDEKDANHIPCRKFVCKSVKVYKDMCRKYCENAVDGYEKHNDTCSKLKLFYSTYNLYFLKNVVKKDQIPSLDDIQNTYLTKCQKYEEEQTLHQISVGQNPSESSSITLPQDSNSDEPASITLPEGENRSSPMSSTVSTALGTVAGASSILALLYKFTPGRRWIHSGFGRQSGRISNDLYAEGPNELLFQGFESEDMSSYNARYNIGYGSS